MPLLNKLTYAKKKPWRDAKLFIIICEGERREFQYFNFFDGLSPKLKVVAVPSEAGKSAPKHLLDNAAKAEAQFDDGGEYELWIVMDIDKWESKDLHEVQTVSNEKASWSLAISNPCFEVWLYFHFEKGLPIIDDIDQCKTWKPLLHSVIEGGFDSAYHPTLLDTANQNAKANYESEGYFPKVGSTQIYQLGEKISSLLGNILDDYQ